MGLVGREIHYRHVTDDSIDHEDLRQEGRLGLWKAIQTFDVDRSYTDKKGKRCYFKFSTYACYWIKSFIGRFLEEQRLIHLPSSRQEKIIQISLAEGRFQHLYGRAPTLAELEEETGIPIKKIEDYLEYPRVLYSIDEPYSTKNTERTTTMGEMIADGSSTTYQKRLVDRDWLERLIGMLPTEERVVIENRFDWHERGEEKTYRQLGGTLGISFEAVRLRQNSALKKLKRYHRILNQIDENVLAEKTTVKLLLWAILLVLLGVMAPCILIPVLIVIGGLVAISRVIRDAA
jgi:RNA polymerase primary sigma factor